jgi:ribonuclease D
MFKESITKEELTDLPLRWFEGKIDVIDTFAKVKSAVKKLQNQSAIGFDTETKPAFKKGINNQVALLQLSTRNHAFLFRLNKIGLPDEIRELLADPNIIKPGVAIHDDIKILRNLSDFDPAGFVDLQEHAKERGIQNFSLKKLTAIACGFRISKGQQLSNWEADNLTEAQQIYAATDAWAALEIYLNFSDQYNV